MKNVTPFSKREWILSIVILLLIQFLVHWMSLKYGSSVSALGYVSFAGTVISILLGLIAIIYAFVQSFTQANSVVEIREQIDKLIDAGNDIVKSKDDLHRSAIELSEITDEISLKLGENILATKEVAGNFGRLSDLLATQKPAEEGVDVSGVSVEQEKASRSLFKSSKVYLAVIVSAIAEGVKRDFQVKEIEKKIVDPLAGVLEVHTEYVRGLMLMALLALEAEGFIEIYMRDEKWELKACNDFNAECERAFSRGSLEEAPKELLALWSVLKDLD